MLRDVSTAARQWLVTGTAPARDAFALACLDLADTVDEQTADEEAVLLPLLGEHLSSGDWAVIARSSHCRLTAREQLLVLGLALEDSCAGDRARLLSGVPKTTRTAWRVRVVVRSASPAGAQPASSPSSRHSRRTSWCSTRW